jgi:hypothetical protein
MLSQIHYLVRSQQDGRYLSANLPAQDGNQALSQAYLLVFQENFEARSYLNKYAGDLSDRFAVESLTGPQLRQVLDRWGFAGIALVQDPLIPTIEFMPLA